MPATAFSGQNNMKDNIVLIGMPGVGKSTAGVVLAKVLNYDFLDSDLLIQRQAGKRLQELIAELGIDGFNALEEQINSQISVKHTVIATGGSVIYGPRAMAHFEKIGTIVYLQLDYPSLLGRLGDLEGRGVVHKPSQSLSDLYEERCRLYEAYADMVIPTEGKGIQETVAAITDALHIEGICHE